MLHFVPVKSVLHFVDPVLRFAENVLHFVPVNSVLHFVDPVLRFAESALHIVQSVLQLENTKIR